MRFHLPFGVFRDDGGNVAVITALCIIPLMLMVGISVDLSNATRVRLALQDSTDSAALALARNAATIPDTGIDSAARNYINASYDNRASYTLSTATIDRTTLTVTVNATASVPTTFAGIIGKTSIPVSAHSVVKGQGADYEIALALDNSGSMGNRLGSGSTKIAELQNATTALFDAMFTPANSGHVKIGMVPFAASVNVGPSYKTASWMDTGGLGSTAYENFADNSVKRFDLYDSSKGWLRNVSWAGCVESRPTVVNGVTKDYDVNDATPTTSTPDTLFEPMFAPDESDSDNYSYSYYNRYDYRDGSYDNDYLDDEGGNCSGADANKAVSDLVKQARTCKYRGVSVSRPSGSNGPNYGCTTTAITPLTATRSTLDTANDAMSAGGNTNILEGTMWAWRVLSPSAPFTEGSAYNTPNLYKIMIIMTDGENNYSGANNANHSQYFTYGYSRLGRVGSTSSSSSDLIDALDARTKKACDNAKAAGITIYTVGLGTTSTVNTDLLSYCASKTSYFYLVTSGSALTPTFQAIAASINKLRISQ